MVDGSAGATERGTLNYSALSAQLQEHEAIRLRPYDDKTGDELHPGDTLHGKLTIGIGRNLTDRGISLGETQILLANDIGTVVRDLDRHLPSWRSLDEIRQRVLADLAFNLGIAGLLRFSQMLQHLSAGDYHRAADEMLDSQWATQVGLRATRLARMMDLGKPVRLEDVLT